MSDVITLLDTSFAIVVAGWFMFRIERQIRENSKAMIALAKMVEKLIIAKG